MNSTVEVNGCVDTLAPETVDKLQHLVMTTGDLPAMPQCGRKNNIRRGVLS